MNLYTAQNTFRYPGKVSANTMLMVAGVLLAVAGLAVLLTP